MRHEQNNGLNFVRGLINGILISIPMWAIIIFVLSLLVSATKADDLFFYGCMNNKTGKVRKISADVPVCREKETLVSWNQIGPQGPKGDAGDVGATGSQGIQGEPGQQGIAGVNGQDGAPGSKGDKGDTGLQGIPGEQGPQGLPGNDGTQLYVYDGANQKLGLFIRRWEIYILGSDGLLQLYFASSGPITFVDTIQVVYLNTDCTGEPYSWNYLQPPQIAKVSVQNRFFKYTTGEILRTQQYRSQLSVSGCIGTNLSADLYPLEEVFLPFSAPPTGPLIIRKE